MELLRRNGKRIANCRSAACPVPASAILVFLLVLTSLSSGCRKPPAPPPPQKPPEPAVRISPDEFRNRLAQQLDSMCNDRSSEQARRYAIQLRTRLDWFCHVWGQWNEQERRDRLNELQDEIIIIRKGGRPTHAPGARVMLGYMSPIDDARQPYTVGIPDDFKPGKLYPMYFVLHGQGMFSPYQGIHLDPRNPRSMIYGDAISVGAHSRGGMDYRYVAEPDTLRVIEEVCRDYPVDRRRIYLVGTSMGGAGSWYLATRFPDLFAGIGPICGNTDISVWQREWEWKNPPDSPMNPLRQFMRMDTSAVVCAENLLHVPSTVFHGADDTIVPVEHSRSMVGRLRELGYNNSYYIEVPFVGHGGMGVDQSRMCRQNVQPYKPDRIVFKTAWLKYPGAYWARITGMRRGLRYARIEATAADNEIAAETSGITRLEFDLAKAPLDLERRIACSLNGERVFSGFAPVNRVLSLWMDEAGRWAVGLPPDPGWPPRKRINLEGPIEDAFMSRFLLVFGTTAETAEERKLVEDAAREFHGIWASRFGAGCRIKPDRDVTEQDILDSNLILYGNPRQNGFTARVASWDEETRGDELAGRLPVYFDGDAVVVNGKRYSGPDAGVKICYPNPLNPQRYCVLMAGVTARGLYQINTRFGNWFDWVPYDYRQWFDFAVFDDRTNGFYPETMLTVGFFDENWQFAPELTWHAVPKFRGDVLPRKIPPLAEIPTDRNIVFLDDVKPASAWMSKGFVSFNQEQKGRILAPGGMMTLNGVNARTPAVIEYDLKGQFKTFNAVVGVDWPPGTPCPRARADVERVDAWVYGDDRVLWEIKGMTWQSPPETVKVSVEGVKRLKFRTSGGLDWLNGSFTWGMANVEK